MKTRMGAVTVRRGGSLHSDGAVEWLELMAPSRSARFRVTWILLALVVGLLGGPPAVGPAAVQATPGQAFRAYLPLVAQTVTRAELPLPTDGKKDPSVIEAGTTWMLYGDAVGNVTAAKGNHRSMGDVLYLAERDELWLATGTNVVVWDLNRGSHRIVYQGLPAALLSDGNNNVWIGTYREGLNRLSLGEGLIETFVENQRTWCLDMDEAGYVWVCDTAGVKRLSPDGQIVAQWLHEAPFSGARYRPVWDLALGPSGEAYAATGDIDGAIVRLDPDGTTTSIHSVDGAVIDLDVDLDGRIWASHWQNGLLHLSPDGTVLAAWRASAGELLSDQVMEVTVGADGTKWLGTDKGLSRLDPDGSWRTYTQADGLPGAEVRAMTVGRDGDVWLGTSGGLVRLPADQRDRPPGEIDFESWPTEPGALAERHGNDATGDTEGNMWFALDGDGGVARLTADGQWTAYTRESTNGGLAGNVVNAVLQHRDGSMWFATMDGVSRRTQEGAWTAITVADGLVSPACRALAQDPSGNVWVGTDGGFSVISADGVVRPWRRDLLYMWYRDGSVGVDTSLGLHDQQIRHRYSIPDGQKTEDLVAVVISPNTRPGAWFRDGTYVSGTSANLASVFHVREEIRFPAGKSLADVVAAERLADDSTRVWYRDGTTSSGSRRDLAATAPVTYALPSGKSPGDIVEIAIDDDDKVHTWYRDGTVSVGDYTDLGRWGAPVAATFAPGRSAQDVVGIGFLRGGRIRSLAADGAGNVWLAMAERQPPPPQPPVPDPGWGLRRLSPDLVLSSHKAENGLPQSWVRSVGTTPGGGVWVATQSWVTTYAPDETIVEKRDDSRVTRRLWESNGTFWSVSWTNVTRQESAGSPRVWRFDESPSGLFLPRSAALGGNDSVWIPTADGLHQLRLQGVGDRCGNALDLGMSESVGTAIETADDVDVFRFDVDTPYSAIEITVTDPEHRLEVLRTCEDAGGSSIGASSGTGRHIAPSAFEGFEHRHQYLLGSKTGPQYVAVRARAGMFEGAALAYRIRVRTAHGAPVDQARTLILTHRPTLEVSHPGTPETWRDWELALDRLAARPEVQGRLITDMLDDKQVDPRVVQAFQNWQSAPLQRLNVEAGELAGAVRAWLIDLKQGKDGQPPAMPLLSYVVIAGDDNVLPFMRARIEAPVGESHGWERESAYVAERGLINWQSGTGSALKGEWTLSDDAYAMSSKVAWGVEGLTVDLPQLAVGRLVESPADMVRTIETFLARDGVLRLDESLSAGYDFMADGAELGDAYVGRYGGVAEERRRRLIGDAHRQPDWHEALLKSPFDLLFFAAHATHYRHETPGNGAVTARDILAAEADYAGRLVYGLACHAGLNVPGDGAEHGEPVDFPEAWSRRGATYIGTTGWAYGFEGAVQYQEDLMAEFTRRVVSGGGMSVGEALTKAKRSYYWDMGELNHFHAKTIAGTVLYGLPMYKVATADVAAEFADDAAVVQAPGALERLGPDLAVVKDRLRVRAGSWVKGYTRDGEYYALAGRRPRPEAGQPVQPRLRWPRFTEMVPGESGQVALEPRSAVWLGGVYQDHAGFRPWVLGAGSMGRLAETTRPVAFSAPGWFPSVPVRLRTLPPEASKWREGNEAQVVVTLGQFDSTTSTERVYDSAEVAVYYSASPDVKGPMVDGVETRLVGDRHEVAVLAHDASTILGVYVTWTDGGGEWRSEWVAAPGGDGWWRATLPREAIALVQVVDRAGNVAVADNGGAFYRLAGW